MESYRTQKNSTLGATRPALLFGPVAPLLKQSVQSHEQIEVDLGLAC
jgi:hypothetical protein